MAAFPQTSCRGIPSRRAASTPDTSSCPPECRSTPTSQLGASVPPVHTAHTPRTEPAALELPVVPPAAPSSPVLEQPEVASEAESEAEEVESAVAASVSAHTPELPASYRQE